MLLLWSRLFALALMASLTTCSPVPASPLNAVDTTPTPTLELVPGSEQVAKFTKRAISGSPTRDHIPTSILTKGVSHTALPSITIPSGGGPYKSGDIINLKWIPTNEPKYANLCFKASVDMGEGIIVKAREVIVTGMPLYKGYYDIDTLDLTTLTSGARKRVRHVVVNVFFALPASNHHKGDEVIGPYSPSFIMQIEL